MFTTAKVTQELTKENILKYISEEDIFRKYIAYEFKLGESFSSPLRIKDNNPNFNVYYNRYTGRVEYKDYAYSQGTAFTFVMELFKLTFSQALNKIVKDFNLPLGNNTLNVTNTAQPSTIIVEPTIKERVSYVANTKSFTIKELQYWLDYGISKELLEQYNVYSCSTIFKNKTLSFISTELQPIFIYYFPKTGNMKIYRPFSDKKGKWRGNIESEKDVQGMDQLPEKGSLLIITKSLKDVMTLRALGYLAIAPHGETNHLSKSFISHLQSRFDKIVTLYDRDITGMLSARKIWQEYKIPGVFIPKKYQFPNKTKDISDLYKNYGIDECLLTLNKIIK